MADNPNNLAWEEYRYHLTHELSRMADALERVSDQVDKIELRQMRLERDAKWAGSIFGFAAAAIVEAARALASVIFSGRH